MSMWYLKWLFQQYSIKFDIFFLIFCHLISLSSYTSESSTISLVTNLLIKWTESEHTSTGCWYTYSNKVKYRELACCAFKCLCPKAFYIYQLIFTSQINITSWMICYSLLKILFYALDSMRNNPFLFFWNFTFPIGI
jgi:hypothetical protein